MMPTSYMQYHEVPAFALSCQKISVEESASYVDVVFLGKVVHKQHGSTNNDTIFVEFDVTESYKGITSNVEIIASDEGPWDPVFKEKEEYVIFANYPTKNYADNDKVLVIPLCSNTRVSNPNIVEQLRVLFSEEVIENNIIPSWIRSNAEWWYSGQIDDNTFVRGIEFLIKMDIIHLEKIVLESSTEKSDKIPTWIKNNAKWWNEKLITDNDFLKGIKFLVEKGIIVVQKEN